MVVVDSEEQIAMHYQPHGWFEHATINHIIGHHYYGVQQITMVANVGWLMVFEDALINQ